MNTSFVAAAAEGNTVLPAEVISAITDGCQKVATGAQEGIIAVLPLGLGVFALLFGIRVGVNFLRSRTH